MRRFLLLFAAVFLSLAAFAETSKLTVEKPKEQTTFSQTTTDGITWTFNVTWKTSAPTTALGVDSSKGYQIGSKSCPATSVVVTSSGLSTADVTSITVNTSGASSIKANLGATVNGVTYQNNGTDTYTLTATATNVKFEGSEAGEVTLTYSNTSDKAIYIKSITVEYTTTGGGSETLSFDKSSVELTYGDVFTAPTLSNADGLTINWSSSNTDVATVDGGNVSIVGIGTTTITATDASDNTNTASYTITVKDPNAIEDDVIKHGIFDGEAGSAYAKEGSYTSGNGIIYKARYSNTNGIQLNKNTASPGIVVTENPHGYVLSKIIVEWNSKGTAGRDLEIIGSNEPFNGPTDLNATAVGAAVTKGKILGTLSSPNETEFDVLATGYYCYIGLRATSTINMDKITLVWTRVEPEFKADITIAVDETEGDANKITFSGLQESHGLAFDFTGYNVYLNGTMIGDAGKFLSYLPFVKDGKFTISNGSYTYPIAVKWPITDFSTIKAKVTEAKYFAYCDEEHTVTGYEDGMWYLDAEYTIAPDCEVSNLYCEMTCTLFDPDNELGSTVEKKGNNIVCVNRVGMFMLGDDPTFETDVNGSFNVTLTFPFYVQTALKGMMLPAYTEKITSFEGVETLIDVTALAGQVPQPGDEGGKISGVESVVVDNEGAVEYFNLQGVRVEGALTPGIYIRRTATGTSKVAIR